jgi:hypothetical protein
MIIIIIIRRKIIRITITQLRSASIRSHTRGSMTLKQTEGWLLLSTPGCPRQPKRQNLLHDGSTAGDALTGVGVPTDEFFDCSNNKYKPSHHVLHALAI